MITEENCRTAMLLGSDGVQKLQTAGVLIFGIGGVGGHIAEALARAGIGRITLVDRDDVSLSNINRQTVALHSTLGKAKVDVMADRISDINPTCRIQPVRLFYLPETADRIPFDGYDYIIDAVDNVTAKLSIIRRAVSCNIPVISCMGTGNKLHPELLQIDDLSKTTVCPLARVVRRELRKFGIEHIPVLYSTEEPRKPDVAAAADFLDETAAVPPASVSFVPSVAGLMIAGYVVRNLTKQGL